jgi:methyl-accepting chemotaxis protein
MADVETRLDRIEQHIERLASGTGEMAREVRTLVQGLAADRTAFRETLRDLSGFVATAGLTMEHLLRQVQRLAQITETGFTEMQTMLGENNRQITENNRQIAENTRQIAENNRLITENNAVIRRLLDILARGRGDGEGPPQ